jgi:hypothetical protein
MQVPTLMSLSVNAIIKSINQIMDLSEIQPRKLVFNKCHTELKFKKKYATALSEEPFIIHDGKFIDLKMVKVSYVWELLDHNEYLPSVPETLIQKREVNMKRNKKVDSLIKQGKSWNEIQFVVMGSKFDAIPLEYVLIDFISGGHAILSDSFYEQPHWRRRRSWLVNELFSSEQKQ